MLSHNDAITIQEEIENRYGVKMYPHRSTFQANLLEFYNEKRFLSNKQLESIRNPKFPIRGI